MAATPGCCRLHLHLHLLLHLLLLLLRGAPCAASPSHARRLICWQAIMNCQAEPECNYAYDHYLRACGPVLSGERRKCPSHCISSLVQLNLTRSGPALEDCGCARDELCLSHKRAIEPCLPRTTSTGCTEARRQCQRDKDCSHAMDSYLDHCGKLFSGAVCTNACRSVIATMRKIPKGQQLDTCMCDGTERAICEFVKGSMKALCFEAAAGDAYDASGADDAEPGEPGDDYYEELEPVVGASSSAARAVARGGGVVVVVVVVSAAAVVPLLASILALL